MFKSQILWSFFIRGSGILISFLQVPILLNTLHAEKYGVWLTLLNIVNWITVFDLGVTNGLRNKLSELYALNETIQIRKLIFNSFLFLIVIFSIFVFTYYIFSDYIHFQKLFNTKLIPNLELRNVFNLVFLGIVFRFVFQIPVIYETARGRTHISNLLLFFGNILSILLLVLMKYLKIELTLNLIGLITVWLPNAIYFLYFLWFFRFKYDFLIPNIKDYDFKILKPLIKLSGHFFLIQFTALVLFASIPFILTQLLSPSHATEYNLANSIFNIPLILMGILCTPITPLVTQAFVVRDKVWLKSIIKRFIGYIVLLILLTWFLFFIADWIFDLWIGKKLIINKTLIFYLAVYTSINIFLQPFANIFNGIGKLKIIAYLSPVGVILFLVTAYYFTKHTGNSSGVVIGLIFSSLVGIIYIPYKVNKEIKGMIDLEIEK